MRYTYTIRAVLGNPGHPEYGVATIPFPLTKDNYSSTLDLLAPLEIDAVVEQDCRIEKIDSGYAVLDALVGKCVNVDELDYLAQLLDGFSQWERDQFQAMAFKLGLGEIKDFINLTFCCTQATVITDFRNLEEIGKDHLMTLNGGFIASDRLEAADGKQIAMDLIRTGKGVVTPYGVVYDNGMVLEEVYKGAAFPEYFNGSDQVVGIRISKAGADDDLHSAMLFLPMPDEKLSRSLQRIGIVKSEDICIDEVEPFRFNSVFDNLDVRGENLVALNKMSSALSRIPDSDTEKYSAALKLTEGTTMVQFMELARNLDSFDFVPGVKNAREYGEYMIKESGHFDYDPNLESFYDYEEYGAERMASELGKFTDEGYIAYRGEMGMDEMLFGSDDEMEMKSL